MGQRTKFHFRLFYFQPAEHVVCVSKVPVITSSITYLTQTVRNLCRDNWENLIEFMFNNKLLVFGLELPDTTLTQWRMDIVPFMDPLAGCKCHHNVLLMF